MSTYDSIPEVGETEKTIQTLGGIYRRMNAGELIAEVEMEIARERLAEVDCTSNRDAACLMALADLFEASVIALQNVDPVSAQGLKLDIERIYLIVQSYLEQDTGLKARDLFPTSLPPVH